jgi:peptide methionine sulfoxide reductase MsrA
MPATTERAILAGGCFWGMQRLVRRLPGVVSTRVTWNATRTATPATSSARTGSCGSNSCQALVCLAGDDV